MLNLIKQINKTGKNQDGAISLFAMLSMLFFLSFILGTYMLVNRKNATQLETLKETQKIYESGITAEEAYDNIYSELNSTATITFNANGGLFSNSEQIIQANYEKGYSFEQFPTNPTRENYIFDGWYDDINSGNSITESSVVMESTILYAHWEEDLTDS